MQNKIFSSLLLCLIIPLKSESMKFKVCDRVKSNKPMKLIISYLNVPYEGISKRKMKTSKHSLKYGQCKYLSWAHNFSEPPYGAKLNNVKILTESDAGKNQACINIHLKTTYQSQYSVIRPSAKL